MAPPILLDPPLVTVRFRAGVALSYSPAATAEVAARPDADWAALEVLFPGLKLVPLLGDTTAATVNGVVGRALLLTPTYVPARFLSMFRVALPPKSAWQLPSMHPANLIAQVRAAMFQHLPVDRVTIESIYSPPPVSDDPPGATGTELHHLHAAPKSIGVEKVWSLAGGRGQGEVFADVEQGWKPDHADLAGKTSADDLTVVHLPGGVNDPDWLTHGAKVLGTVAARENGVYGLGVAPEADTAILAYEHRASAGMVVTEEALFQAIAELVTRPPGSVLLLEVQKDAHDADSSIPAGVKGPCEMKVELYELIQLAVACHVVVVEAAGNADDGVRLDLDAHPALLHGDSGAILVSQAMWRSDYKAPADDAASRLEVPDACCVGSRIDCCAWGDNVWAASAYIISGSGATATWADTYDAGFNGSSSASAILAGVAIVTQAMYRAETTSYLPPLPMRALLRDRTPGKHTPVMVPDATSGDMVEAYDVVGVQPSLEEVASEFGLLPDVYIRDTTTDDGDPGTGKLCRSPDIIVATTPLGMTPDEAFGDLSGTTGDDDLGDDPVYGSPAQLYVRVRNRGGVDAAGAKVTVYWSEPSLLLQGWLWKTNKIGEAVVDVPAGGATVVAGPIEWAAVPAAGHYCFIATVDHPLDDVVIPDKYREWTYFKKHVATDNNVAWRNFNVIEVPADGGGDGGDDGGGDGGVEDASDGAGGLAGGGGPTDAIEPLEALVVGPEEGDGETMELRVVARLPRRARLELELPEALARVMALPDGAFRADEAGGARRARLRAVGMSRLGQARLARRERHRVRLHVALPRRARAGAYEVALVQLHGGQPVGRVTWRLRVGRRRRRRRGPDRPDAPA
ncbi:MAG: S8 family serine peptidase [Planctomycetota bacterium]|jgi:hypothetical protein